jgi:hypothetical protein
VAIIICCFAFLSAPYLKRGSFVKSGRTWHRISDSFDIIYPEFFLNNRSTYFPMHGQHRNIVKLRSTTHMIVQFAFYLFD